jgi:hypothetical protein
MTLITCFAPVFSRVISLNVFYWRKGKVVYLYSFTCWDTFFFCKPVCKYLFFRSFLNVFYEQTETLLHTHILYHYNLLQILCISSVIGVTCFPIYMIIQPSCSLLLLRTLILVSFVIYRETYRSMDSEVNAPLCKFIHLGCAFWRQPIFLEPLMGLFHSMMLC